LALLLSPISIGTIENLGCKKVRRLLFFKVGQKMIDVFEITIYQFFDKTIASLLNFLTSSLLKTHFQAIRTPDYAFITVLAEKI